MSGPTPKPAHLRQRTNKKSSASQITAPIDPNVPPIPNPDGRTWHKLTLLAWAHAWESPMSGQWLETDTDALGRLAVLWDQFYKEPDAKVMAEIRLQESRFGLSPLDRSRLQWEVGKAADAEEKVSRRNVTRARRTGTDPRAVLTMVK
jgi:hypothetical protein